MNAQGGAGGSVKDSGNSSNVNTATANGGAGGQGGAGGSAQQSQSNKSVNNNASSASNQANGNGSNSNNTTNNIAAPKIPVPTAYAPATIPTSPCFKGFGGGAQMAQAGISFGGGKVDPNCAILETARSFDMVNERLAACKVKISNKYAKKAGVTLEDCMHVEMTEAPPVAEVSAPILPPVAAAPLTVTVPVTIVNPAPAPVKVIESPVVTDEKKPVVKKRVARRLPPGCQNVVTLKCATSKEK